MSFIEERPGSAWGTTRMAATGANLDLGLRAHMLSVYNWMAGGLLVTALTALAVTSSASLTALFFTVEHTRHGLGTSPTLLGWLAILSPLAFVLVMSFRLQRMALSTLQALFWGFCAVMGISMASLCLVYTGGSVATAFFVSAGMFAGASLYGYTTGADLSRMGSLMMMGLIGMILAGMVNIVLHSTMLQFVLSVVGVIVFVGITAWDTQRIKADYLDGAYASPEAGAKLGIMAALNLYLNFINLFQLVLQLTGNRRSN